MESEQGDDNKKKLSPEFQQAWREIERRNQIEVMVDAILEENPDMSLVEAYQEAEKNLKEENNHGQ